MLPTVETGYCAKCPLFWYFRQGESQSSNSHEKACIKESIVLS